MHALHTSASEAHFGLVSGRHGRVRFGVDNSRVLRVDSAYIDVEVTHLRCCLEVLDDLDDLDDARTFQIVGP